MSYLGIAILRRISATQEDALGEFYLSNVDFLKNGVPASIIATAVSLSSARSKIVDFGEANFVMCVCVQCN